MAWLTRPASRHLNLVLLPRLPLARMIVLATVTLQTPSGFAAPRACLAVDSPLLGRTPKALVLTCGEVERAIRIGPGGCFECPAPTCSVRYLGENLIRRGRGSFVRYYWRSRRRALLVARIGFRLGVYELDSTMPPLRMGGRWQIEPTAGEWTIKEHDGSSHKLPALSRELPESSPKLVRAIRCGLTAHRGQSPQLSEALWHETRGREQAALVSYRIAARTAKDPALRRFAISRIADLSLRLNPLAKRVPSAKTVQALDAQQRVLTHPLQDSKHWRCYLLGSRLTLWAAAVGGASQRKPLLDALDAQLEARVGAHPVPFSKRSSNIARALLAKIRKCRWTGMLQPAAITSPHVQGVPLRLRRLVRAGQRPPVELLQRRGRKLQPLLRGGPELVILANCQSARGLARHIENTGAISAATKKRTRVVVGSSCIYKHSFGVIGQDTRWTLRWPPALAYGVFCNKVLLLAAPLSSNSEALKVAASTAEVAWTRARCRRSWMSLRQQ